MCLCTYTYVLLMLQENVAKYYLTHRCACSLADWAEQHKATQSNAQQSNANQCTEKESNAKQSNAKQSNSTHRKTSQSTL